MLGNMHVFLSHLNKKGLRNQKKALLKSARIRDNLDDVIKSCTDSTLKANMWFCCCKPSGWSHSAQSLEAALNHNNRTTDQTDDSQLYPQWGVLFVSLFFFSIEVISLKKYV